jgi:hypothetical protein
MDEDADEVDEAIAEHDYLDAIDGENLFATITTVLNQQPGKQVKDSDDNQRAERDP